MARSSRRATVAIADDHPLYREALEQAISRRPDLELVAAVTDGRAALEQIRKLNPDVAVLDMRMPGLRGLEVIEALARDGSPTRVLGALGRLGELRRVRGGCRGRRRLLVQGCRA